jgi:hypothetical protein
MQPRADSLLCGTHHKLIRPDCDRASISHADRPESGVPRDLTRIPGHIRPLPGSPRDTSQ